MENGLTIALARINKEAVEQTGSLDLSNLGLRSVPESIFDLIHLTHLKIGNHYGEGPMNTLSNLDRRFSNFISLESQDWN